MERKNSKFESSDRRSSVSPPVGNDHPLIVPPANANNANHDRPVIGPPPGNDRSLIGSLAEKLKQFYRVKVTRKEYLISTNPANIRKPRTVKSIDAVLFNDLQILELEERSRGIAVGERIEIKTVSDIRKYGSYIKDAKLGI